MKKYLIIISLMISVFILGGCSLQKTEVSAVVTKTGTISAKNGEEYLLVTDDGIVSVTSGKVNLDDYMKKPIKVTGMFSGTTLYVDKVE